MWSVIGWISFLHFSRGNICLVCLTWQCTAWLKQRRGASYRGLICLLLSNSAPPDSFHFRFVVLSLNRRRQFIRLCAAPSGATWLYTTSYAYAVVIPTSVNRPWRVKSFSQGICQWQVAPHFTPATGRSWLTFSAHCFLRKTSVRVTWALITNSNDQWWFRYILLCRRHVSRKFTGVNSKINHIWIQFSWFQFQGPASVHAGSLSLMLMLHFTK